MIPQWLTCLGQYQHYKQVFLLLNPVNRIDILFAVDSKQLHRTHRGTRAANIKSSNLRLLAR